MAGLSHAQKVCRLYRGAIRATKTWAVDFRVWEEEVRALAEGWRCAFYAVRRAPVRGIMDAFGVSKRSHAAP